MRTERGGLGGADERLTAGCRASPRPVVPCRSPASAATVVLLALRAIVAREPDPDWKRRVQHRVDDLE